MSKNGNLLLSVPMRGDGSIDEDEVAILEALARWFAVNGEAIYGTRPGGSMARARPGRGPAFMNEGDAPPFTAEDIRFTTKAGALNALFLEWPDGEAAIASLGRNALPEAMIERVELLGGGPLEFRRDAEALRVPDASSGGRRVRAGGANFGPRPRVKRVI